MNLTYFNIQRFCIHDGPGIRTTVFLKGCPLNCLWCHNPESKSRKTEMIYYTSKCTGCGRCIGFCDARSIVDGHIVYDRSKCTACGKCAGRCFASAVRVCGKTEDTSDILAEVKKDVPFYKTSGGGMTVSGGEPSMQADGVLELIRAAKESGISSAIETCGFGSPDFFREAAALGTLFLYDIKGVDREKHKINTGVYPDRIHENLDMLISAGAEIIIRMPLIPGKNDSESDLSLLSDFLAARKDRIRYAEIMPYHELGRDKNAAVGREVYDPILPGKQFSHSWKDSLTGSGVEIRISGE